ncbi:MAG: hypothetical protein A2381_18445 [Bdellovibrionales bacterium RIFOXYB1_FULL_37_110]|nr:MAG: hypothetical protein A2417_01325 [Bdellovibrionales bacterium RIFOXYC1_FULL_37_79]OFZ59011.1 MAG: hypothetical protein A2381_18445 [Bdellovibrionales bacterium RIFOXYB1_FULL_37_110]OFZ65116.1 MAG: hypothetical protein A2577_04760 [Bdellovibrionales bacterium RIFOXYD1_FULL_36_51]
METKVNYIHSYYELMDKFLIAQFKNALGEISQDDVNHIYHEVIGYLEKNISDSDADFVVTQKDKINEIKGIFDSSFHELALLKTQFNATCSSINIKNQLENFRCNKVFDNILLVLRKRYEAALPFVSGVLPISQYRTWFAENDCKISCGGADKLMNVLLAQQEINVKKIPEIKLFPSKNNKYFMIQMHCKPTCYVAYGGLDSLFKVSTFCHEIGHCCGDEDVALFDKFYSGQMKKELIVSNEIPAYRFEKIFSDNLKNFLINTQIDEGMLQSCLLDWKKMKFYLDVLSSYCCLLYFSGKKLAEIQFGFNQLALKMEPEFKISENSLQWFEYTNLAFPLSKLGYIDAYLEVFAK